MVILLLRYWFWGFGLSCVIVSNNISVFVRIYLNFLKNFRNGDRKLKYIFIFNYLEVCEYEDNVKLWFCKGN